MIALSSVALANKKCPPKVVVTSRWLAVEFVRELANERGLPLVKLADFAGSSNAHLGRLLAAEQSATLDTLLKLADALAVRVRDLLPDD